MAANDQVTSGDFELFSIPPVQHSFAYMCANELVFKMPLLLQQGCVCKSEPGTSLLSVHVLTDPAGLFVALLYIFPSRFCTAADLRILTS